MSWAAALGLNNSAKEDASTHPLPQVFSQHSTRLRWPRPRGRGLPPLPSKLLTVVSSSSSIFPLLAHTPREERKGRQQKTVASLLPSCDAGGQSIEKQFLPPSFLFLAHSQGIKGSIIVFSLSSLVVSFVIASIHSTVSLAATMKSAIVFFGRGYRGASLSPATLLEAFMSLATHRVGKVKEHPGGSHTCHFFLPASS